MSSLLKRLVGRYEAKDDTKVAWCSQQSDKPYILSSIFYLSVILFVGVPMWYYTCSITRYSLPDLNRLEEKLSAQPKLHLDISVVQLSKVENDKQSTYLRQHLPVQLETSLENVTYNINWRIRRPTIDEVALTDKHQDKGSLATLLKLESELVRIHKPVNRFRLFMYLIDEPYHAAYCNNSLSDTYTLGFERFVYLCPSRASAFNDNLESIVKLIVNVLYEVYSRPINQERVKHILEARLDLLFSMIPESSDSSSIDRLPLLADKIHQIYDKNIPIELKELVNTRLITQNVIDLSANSIGDTAKDGVRHVQLDKTQQLFYNFGTRLNKHSAKNVANVLLIVPDTDKEPLVFKEGLSILEGRDSNSMLIANDDKSLVLGLRAIVRRSSGLSSVNICENCLVRRDVFFNRWEIDAVMGMLTLTKLHSVLLSLKSISQQVVGIKIPKEVATIAMESHESAFKAIDYLDTKRTLESYRLATKAYELSETAFYDPSLLESLYFPDDFKYAIYLPLLGPLIFPFVSSIFRLVRMLYVSLQR